MNIFFELSPREIRPLLRKARSEYFWPMQPTEAHEQVENAAPAAKKTKAATATAL